VQRVPVRVTLDRKELAEHPLQIGLSMKVDVDTHDRSAGRLERLVRDTPAYETRAFAPVDPQANERIERIIAENSTAPSLAATAAKAAHGASGAR